VNGEEGVFWLEGTRVNFFFFDEIWEENFSSNYSNGVTPVQSAGIKAWWIAL
jgi:hypothetical protein